MFSSNAENVKKKGSSFVFAFFDNQLVALELSKLMVCEYISR